MTPKPPELQDCGADNFQLLCRLIVPNRVNFRIADPLGIEPNHIGA